MLRWIYVLTHWVLNAILIYISFKTCYGDKTNYSIWTCHLRWARASSRSPLSPPLADWAGISDPRALELAADSNQIAANNRSSRVCSRKCKHWAQPFYIYLNTKLLKAPIGQKWCHLCRLGLWKSLDGDPRV